MDDKPLIVISAIRYFQGGTVVIVDDCLEYVSRNLSQQYRIKALVYKKEIYTPREGIEFISFPKARRSAAFRLYYEYVCFKKLSRDWQPVLWLSMQDSTPNVIAKIQAVYFHNPLLLYNRPFQLFRMQPRLGYIWLLYKLIYTRGIRKNSLVVAQQENVARYLSQQFHIPDKKLLVFPPAIKPYPVLQNNDRCVYTFIYPATALAFKNFRVIFEACAIVNRVNDQYKVYLTITGDENRYIRSLKKKYPLAQIEYKGFLKREAVFSLYNESDCMLFPSLAETWGLPLSEFALQHKPVICAALPYAKETLANYSKVRFFNPHDAKMLAAAMLQAMNNELNFDRNAFSYTTSVVNNWEEMFSRVLNDHL